MDWDTTPTLKDFDDTYMGYMEDIGGVRTTPTGYIAAHDIVGSITVWDDDDVAYDITGLEVDQLIGCGCPSGIIIKIKRVVE